MVTQCRMPLTLLFSRSAERHTLVYQNVVADLGRLADHHPRTVIDEEPSADGRPGVNLNPGEEPANLRDQTGQQRNSGTVETVSQTVQQDRMKSGITKHDLKHTLGGRIFPKY